MSPAPSAGFHGSLRFDRAGPLFLPASYVCVLRRAEVLALDDFPGRLRRLARGAKTERGLSSRRNVVGARPNRRKTLRCSTPQHVSSGTRKMTSSVDLVFSSPVRHAPNFVRESTHTQRRSLRHVYSTMTVTTAWRRIENRFSETTGTKRVGHGSQARMLDPETAGDWRAQTRADRSERIAPCPCRW